MTIRVLPPDIAARIAAGEVIERPASVVKELVENALDAGANAIAIDLENGGRKLIRVTDNGTGIPPEEQELAFTRHATSKIANVSDLEHIATLGFRGEALASIAAVSHVAMTSSVEGRAPGLRIELEGGEISSRQPVGAPSGVTITVTNLFYNIPARLKFLKKETTERQLITLIVSRYALAYPHVRFALTHNQQELVRTSGSGSVAQTLAEIYGSTTAAQMIPLLVNIETSAREDLPDIQVEGYIGLPALNRSNRSHISLFVNGRWIQDSSISYAVIQAYHTMMMVGRYPVAVILIRLPPQDIDVNIHPAKAEVRFRQPDAVFSAVQRVVRQTLMSQTPPRAVAQEVLWGTPEWAARRDRLAQIANQRQTQLGLLAGEDVDDTSTALGETSGEEGIGTPSKPRSLKAKLPALRIIGQAGGTYVVAEGPRGLYLIDQHAAHERILYEDFMAKQSTNSVISQELLQPIAIELSPDQAALIDESLDALVSIGFRIEEFGRNAVRVSAVPVLAASSDPAEALLGAIGEIECGEMPGEATREQQIISKICKRIAVKGGQVLSQSEMDALVRRLERCQSPQTCPHGRPTMLHLSAEELGRQFGRLGAV